MPTQALPPSIPTAHHIAKERLKSLLGHQWAEGDRLPPTAEVAKLIKSGQRNTGVAIRELAREGWLVSQQGLGTFVVRVPGNAIPQGPLSEASVVLFSDNRTDGDDMIVNMIEGFASVVDMNGARTQRRSVSYLDGLESVLAQLQPNDVIVMINPDSSCTATIPSTHIVIEVSTAHHSPIIHNGGRDRVTINQEQGAALAADMLMECGYGVNDICFIGVPDSTLHTRFDQTSTSRLWGLEQRLGARIPTGQCLFARNYGEIAGAISVRAYLELEHRPVAIFMATDELAVGFVKGAAAHGLNLCEDYQLIGFDGQGCGRHMQMGPLTTVEVSATEMGRRAAELLIDRVQHPDQPPRNLQIGCKLFRGATLHPSRTHLSSSPQEN